MRFAWCRLWELLPLIRVITIFLLQLGPRPRTSRNYGLDFQIVGVEIKKQTGAVEDIALAEIDVLFEIHLAVRLVEDHVELTKHMQPDISRRRSQKIRRPGCLLKAP